MIEYHATTFADRLEFGADSAECVHLVNLRGRGAQLLLPAGWTSVWLPLRGSFGMETAHCQWILPGRSAMTWNDGAVRGVSHGPGWCLVLACPDRVWQRTWRAHADPQADLLSWEHPCPRELKRMLVRLARMAGGNGIRDARCEALLRTLQVMVHEFQAPARRLLARCNGRSAHRKHRTLQRLLRVERIVRSSRGAKVALLHLARVANYSPHHLIRVYRSVFGETPAEQSIRLRTLQAWELVRDTRMPVCEITESLGFDSQSSFCRAFKNAFGMTTGQVRRRQAPPRGEGCNVYDLRRPAAPPRWTAPDRIAGDSHAA